MDHPEEAREDPARHRREQAAEDFAMAELLGLPDAEAGGPSLAELKLRDSVTLVTEVSRQLLGAIEPRQLVESILDAAIRITHAERGIVFLRDAETEVLVPTVARRVGGEEVTAIGRISHTILERTAEGEVLIQPDAFADTELREIPSVRLKNIRAVAALPLQAGDAVIGLVYLDAPEGSRAFPRHTHDLLRWMAQFAAQVLEQSRREAALRAEADRLRRQCDPVDAQFGIVTADPRMQLLMRKIPTFAQLGEPVLLLGESGTGKELFARGIHDAGQPGRPFVTVNCGNLTPALAESALFGHCKGAFTDAKESRDGFFRQAEGGTIFLDEVGELSLEVQAKLLRAVEERAIRPVGAEREIPSRVRIVAATTPDLLERIERRQFHDALYFRLSTLELALPPLRERRADIPLLLQHFIDDWAHQSPELAVRFEPEAVDYLCNLPWRGNVRSLKNLVASAVAHFRGQTLTAAQTYAALNVLEREASHTAPARVTRAARGMAGASPSNGPEGRRQEILSALHATHENLTQAAAILGVHRNTLRRWLKRLGVYSP